MTEFNEIEVGIYVRQMEHMIRMFPPDEQRKIAMARESLRKMLELDPLVMTMAMTVTGGEGFVRLIKDREKLITELAKK